MKGFFRKLPLATMRQPISLIPRCGACGLSKTCLSPKMATSGKGERGILIVGEAPGKTEDEQGRQFVGKSGQFLQEKLRSLGIEMRRDCWITNAIICRPPSNKTPDNAKVEYCRPNLVRTIAELQPTVIIPLGGIAIRSLIGWLWKEDTGAMSRWLSWRIPCQRLNAWICPSYHPSHCLRSEDEKNGIPTMFFERDLQRAIKLQNRPWLTIPDYKRELTIIHQASEAASVLRCFTAANRRPVAWDIETDRLKPDSPDAAIVCCSVSDGKTTIAFPWYGEAITAMKELLVSDVPKLGWNIKFEHRWARARLGLQVRNWLWDGMLASHIADNRSHITSLKFQAFVQLGQESYDDWIKPYLHSKGGGNSRNNIRSADLSALMTYCAMDSLLEYKIGKLQMKRMGMR